MGNQTILEAQNYGSFTCLFPIMWPVVVVNPVLLPNLAIEVFSLHAAELANTLCI